MFLNCAYFIIHTLAIAWFAPSLGELLPTTDISWRWLDAVLADVGFLQHSSTWTELGDTFIQGVVNIFEPGVWQPIDLVTVLTADNPPNEGDDMDVPDDTPPQGIIRQLLEPAVAVVEAALPATTSTDDTVTLVSVHPQPTQFPASVARVGSRVWSSSFPGPVASLSLFTIVIAVLVGFVMGFFARSVSLSAGWDNLPTLFVEVCSTSETVTSCAIDSVVSSAVEAHSDGQIQHGEMVVEDILVPERAKRGDNLEATYDKASIPSGNVSSSDAVQPLRTSIGVQSTSDVREVKDVAIGTEPVSRTSVGVQHEFSPKESKDVSIGSDPVSRMSVGIQCVLAPEETEVTSVPSESRGSLYATAAEGGSPPQITDGPDVSSFPTVSSNNNIYMLAATMSFPSVDDLANVSEFERLRQDVRGFSSESEADHDGRVEPTLPAKELGVSPSNLTSAPASPRQAQVKPLENFCECWGADTKHVWAREFWYRVLRSEELVKTVYEVMFPLDEGATDEHKYEQELGEGLVRLSALRLSEHATNPILRLPYNVLPEDADANDSVFVSAQANETTASSSTPFGRRSPSPFVRPSNPQSRFFESSSSEASAPAPTTQNSLPSPSRTPTAGRRRPALAQMTNTPRGVQTTPFRTPIKVRRGQGAQNGVPTPPPSLRPKLGKLASRFPLAAPTTRRKEESDSPTRPARRCAPSSDFPRWRG